MSGQLPQAQPYQPHTQNNHHVHTRHPSTFVDTHSYIFSLHSYPSYLLCVTIRFSIIFLDSSFRVICHDCSFCSMLHYKVGNRKGLWMFVGGEGIFGSSKFGIVRMGGIWEDSCSIRGIFLSLIFEMEGIECMRVMFGYITAISSREGSTMMVLLIVITV